MEFNLYGTERGVVDDETVNGESGDVMLHHALTVGLDRVLDVGHQRARNLPCHLHTTSSHFQEVEGEVIQGQLSADLNTKLLNILQCSSFPVQLVLANHCGKPSIHYFRLIIKNQ